MQTMVYECISRVLVVAHATTPPSDEEWAAWLKRMGGADFDSVLIVTDGAAPTPKQRSATNVFWDGRERPKMAVLTESMLVRGAIFAFYWLFKGGMRPFSPAHLNEALTFLGVPQTAWQEVATSVARLHRDIRAMEAKGRQAVA